MRKLLIITAITAFALSAVQAQNLDQILAAHYKASGQEKLDKIKTIVIHGKMAYVTAGLESGVVMYQARPDKIRMEANLLGSKIIQTYNGTIGWIFAPTMGIIEPREMEAEEIKAVLQQVQFDSPLWNYREKGNRVELAGSSEDGSAYALKMTQKDGQTMTLLIDKKTSLLTGMITVQNVMGADTEVLLNMKDYKAVKGIQTAHYLSTKVNGEIMLTLNLESIEFDQDLDPALFEKPSAGIKIQ
jgi:outer membrane lipoprotein-sorting protein